MSRRPGECLCTDRDMTLWRRRFPDVARQGLVFLAVAPHREGLADPPGTPPQPQALLPHLHPGERLAHHALGISPRLGDCLLAEPLTTSLVATGRWLSRGQTPISGLPRMADLGRYGRWHWSITAWIVAPGRHTALRGRADRPNRHDSIYARLGHAAIVPGTTLATDIERGMAAPFHAPQAAPGRIAVPSLRLQLA